MGILRSIGVDLDGIVQVGNWARRSVRLERAVPEHARVVRAPAQHFARGAEGAGVFVARSDLNDVLGWPADTGTAHETIGAYVAAGTTVV